jgi:hypothetical protein
MIWHNPSLQPTRKNGQLFIGTARRRAAEFFVICEKNTGNEVLSWLGLQ